MDDVRFEAFTAGFPVNPEEDLGDRPARGAWTALTRSQRFQTNYALLDLDTVAIIVDGQRVEPEGIVDLEYSGVLDGRDPSQLIGIRWIDPRVRDPNGIDCDGSETCPTSKDLWLNADYEVLLYLTADGTDWWVHRVHVEVAVDGETRLETDEMNLELWRTPLGEPFEGDLTLDTLELSNARLELATCQDDRQGLRRSEPCA